MTKEERKMLNMSEEEYKEFVKTQPVINGYFAVKAPDYVGWLMRNKNIEVKESTVQNKKNEGVIDSIPQKAFYPENNEVTQTGKQKTKFPYFILMTKKTMTYNGYNDGSKQGKPTTSISKKKARKARLEETAEMLKQRGIKLK